MLWRWYFWDSLDGSAGYEDDDGYDENDKDDDNDDDDDDDDDDRLFCWLLDYCCLTFF